MGVFPFHEFVRYISGKSSYGMAKAIREFYDGMEKTDAEVCTDHADVRKIRTAYAKELVPKLKKHMQRKDSHPYSGCR